MKTGWLGHQITRLTNRDVLIAMALAFPSAVKSANDNNRSSVNTTLVLIGEFCAICDRQALSHIGYGLPKPLVEQLVMCVGEFLTNTSNDAWRELRVQLDENDLLRELETLWPILERLPAATAEFWAAFHSNALTAATVLTTRQVKAWISERSRQPTVVNWEVVSRLCRLDFAVLHPGLRDTGLVMGADVELAWDTGHSRVTVDLLSAGQITRQLSATVWRVVDGSFEAGLETGRRAAMQLLQQRGFGVQTLGVRFELRGPFPPEQITDGSAGLPLALRILADKAELPTFGYLATGAMDPITLNLEPLSVENVLRKRRAMIADGVNHTLLAYAPDDAAQLDMSGLRLIPGPSLEDAARALWGARWDQFVADKQRRRLKELGFERGWGDGQWAGGLHIDGQLVIVPVPQVDELATHFGKARKGITAFLGGPAQSGKTWIAQQLAAKAAELKWHTLVLTPLLGVVPRLEHLRVAIRLCLSPDNTEPSLVILDDLEWDVTFGNLEEELRMIGDDLDVNILAIARSGLETEWRANEGLTSVAGPRRTRDFAERLFANKAFARSRRSLAPLAGRIAQDSGGDLSWLVRLAEVAYGGTDYTFSVQQHILPKFLALSSAERSSAQALASLAYVNLDAPDWFVPVGDRLGDLGVRRGRDNRWMLPSRAVATALLSQNASVRTEVTRNLSRFVAEAMDKDEFEVMRVVVRLSRESPEILAAICYERREELNRWMGKVLRPERLGRVLNALKEHIPSENRGTWAVRLIRMVQMQLDDMSIDDLAICLDLLSAHLFAIEKHAEGPAEWRALLVRLGAAVPKILKRNRSESAPRLRLLRVLWRFHEDAIYGVIRDHAELFLEFQAPFDFRDYRLALEFGELNRKLPPRADLSLFPGVQALVNAKLEDTTFDVYAAQLVFQSSMARLEWTTDVFPRAIKELPAIIARSSPRQICLAMSVLGNFDRALAAKLLTFEKNRLGIMLASAFARFRSAGEMADFVDLTLSTHAHTARRLLYEEVRGADFSARVKRTALECAYRAITERGDSKGAGRLLRATFRVDGTFTSIKGGFGRKLADRLGPSFFLTQCEWEPRTSVLYYLLEGLIAINTPFVADVLDAAIGTIERQIVNTMRPWAPRLALLLADSTAAGQTLAAKLADRVSPDRVLQCMTHAPTAESLELFHRLGSYLHQDQVPYRFVQQFERDPSHIFQVLDAGHRPEIVVRAAKTIRNTLRRGGAEDSGILAASGLERNWPKWLKATRTDGDLAEAIRGLNNLDSRTADEAVRASEDYLLSRAQDAIRRDPQVGASLLDAIEDAAPGVGRALVATMRRSRYGWTGTMRQIAHTQDPREQGTIFSMLAALGGVPDPDEMDNVFARWQNDMWNLANPAGVVVLLRAFAAWDIARARHMAAGLSVERLAVRLRGGVKQDLDWAESLIGALHALDLQNGSEPILDALESLDPERLVASLGPLRASRLLIGLRDWRPKLGLTLAAAASELPSRTSRNRYVGDDGAVVWSIGWLAYALRMYSMSVDFGDDNIPWIYQVPQEHATVVWGVGWLEPRGWVDGLRTRAISAVTASRAPVAPGTAAAVLVVCAQRGELPSALNTLVERALAGPTSLYLLEALAEAGFWQAELAAALVAGKLPSSANAAHLRLHPARARFLRQFGAVRAV